MASLLPGAWLPNRPLAGWQGLARFWIATLLLMGIGGGLLELSGPPLTRSRAGVAVDQGNPLAAAKAGEASKAGPNGKLLESTRDGRSGRGKQGAVADPDPAMLERYAGGANLMLPRIAEDGRTPMTAYAAGFDQNDKRPRVGILVAGIGMSEADSLAAIRNLPGAVTLAVTPYADDVAQLLAVARKLGHEYLLAIPMEPQGYPVNDPDDRYALMTSLPPFENSQRLLAIMSRLTGYVGVTNALGQMPGERLSGVPDQLESVMVEVGHRGLLFLDARTGQPLLPHAWNRSADLIIDSEPADATILDRRLDLLTHLALNKGSAIGIVYVPRPVTLERVAAWVQTLASKGVVLTPISALVQPASQQDAETSSLMSKDESMGAK